MRLELRQHLAVVILWTSLLWIVSGSSLFLSWVILNLISTYFNKYPFFKIKTAERFLLHASTNWLAQNSNYMYLKSLLKTNAVEKDTFALMPVLSSLGEWAWLSSLIRSVYEQYVIGCLLLIHFFPLSLEPQLEKANNSNMESSNTQFNKESTNYKND